MHSLRVERGLVFLIALLLAAGASADTGERGSVPPGESRDGSQPSDGAIVGGSNKQDAGGTPTKSGQSAEKEINQCNQLKGTLRNQCLRDLEGKKPLGPEHGQNGVGERGTDTPAAPSEMR